MSGKKVAVFGIYSTRSAVENATDSLVKAGFPPEPPLPHRTGV